MRAFRIPKGDGTFRVVHACENARERRLYHRLAVRLAKIEREAARKAEVEDVAHGFIRGRNVVTGATPHIGCKVTISMDLSGWYDHIQWSQVYFGVMSVLGACQDAVQLVNRACIPALDREAPNPHTYHPRQGLASSPAAANLAAIDFDRDMLRRLGDLPYKTVYTRYADDLTISLVQEDSVLAINRIKDAVATLAWRHNWPIAEKKTQIQYARKGRRIILGLSVGDHDVRASRSTRRRLRAATHRDPDSGHARGLKEWAACKLPKLERHAVYEAALQIIRTSEDYAIAADILEEAGYVGQARWLRSLETKRGVNQEQVIYALKKER